MKIRRRFTKGLENPYSGQNFVPRKSEIKEPDGRVVFCQEDVMVPDDWSQVATDILAQKYFRKTGVPKEPGSEETTGENDSRQVFHRLAGCWAHWGEKYGYFDSQKDTENFYNEICYMLSRQMAAPNSPQWFNTGLHYAYGITGPKQGHLYVDPSSKKLTRSKNSYEHPQPHACQPFRALVSTPKGLVPIGEIVEKNLVGLKVYDRDGLTDVVATKANGEKEVLRVTLKNGNTLELTADHQVWAEVNSGNKVGAGKQQWIEAGRLEVGMRLCQRTDTLLSKVDSSSANVSEAILVGWLQGDGFVGQYETGTNRSLTIEFMTATEEEYEFLLPHIEKVLPNVAYKVRYVETQDSALELRRIRLYGAALEDFVAKYDLRARGLDMRVPDPILQGGQELACAYLQALFQADGTVRAHKGLTNSYDVVLGSISEDLLRDSQKLMANLGIYSRLAVCRDQRSDRKPYWHLILGYKSERAKFAELIGFIGSDKQEKLAQSLESQVRGKQIPAKCYETVQRIERIGVEPVFDIQTESGNYLSGNILIHNCFIQRVTDDLVNESGIMDLWVREARLFKYGSGTGTNFSNLRGEGEPLSGGGRSSGLMSFLKVGDRAAGVIKSGGTTRRAAKMVCLDLDHPEIEDFIDWKVKEEQKVASLVAGSKIHRKYLQKVLDACFEGKGEVNTDPNTNENLRGALFEAREVMVPDGYLAKVLQLAESGSVEIDFPLFDTDWQSEAYQTVSGQNSNNSVRVPNEFLEKLEKDEDWQLRWRTDGSVCKTIPARKLWEKLNYATWACADPAIQCDTTINEWHTCPEGGRIVASNPCSEYMFLDDTACNLASINLIKFYDEKTGEFKLEEYQHAVRLWTIVLEVSVLMAQFPSKEIAQRSFEYRTLGLGYANLGALLMSMGIPYGSPEAVAVCGALTAILTGESYATSAEMAKELGAFERYPENKEAMLRVIRNHRRAAYNAAVSEYEGLSTYPEGIDSRNCPAKILEAARNAWDRALESGEKFGFRNAQSTVIAPTGTIGLLMDCDTTGIEPDFALVKYKKLAGGGYFKIINQSVPRALKKLGYPAKEVDAIVKYCVGHGTLMGAPHVNHETLKQKGFTEEALRKVEQALTSAFELSFAFNQWTLGESFCKENLGIDEESLKDPSFSILNHLGFSETEIAAANDYASGCMTVEGAPFLKEEHYPVFDCANKCGKYGKRFLGYHTHIDMMAAAQPFISGAISKTINMPHEATLDEIEDAYLGAWKKMVKAISIYRDGSKLSQPLNATMGSLFSGLQAPDRDVENVEIQQVAENMVQQMGNRRELPKRRFGYTVKATISGQRVYLRTGEYDDGSLGEIFVDVYKEGAAYRSLMNAFSIAISLGLQYGVPLEEYVNKFHLFRFEPNGHVSDHDSIKFCSSIVDFIFRDLALNYLGRTDLVHVPPSESPTIGSSASFVQAGAGGGAMATVSENRQASASPTDMALTREEWADDSALAARLAKVQGYEGDPCSECGQFTMVRSGTCLRCNSCGSTSGCS